MKPIYKIISNGMEIDLGKHLISLSCHDESGIMSDSCEIVLDDAGSVIAVPATGANISVYLGYEDIGLSHIGSYIVNEISISGTPSRISIKAHAADFKSTLKEKISGSFSGQTIGSLVNSIASKHGLIPKVSGALADVVIDHIDQTNESDMHFLTRLAGNYGAIAKPANGNLIFALKGMAKSVSGLDLGTTTLDIMQVISWSYANTTSNNISKIKISTIGNTNLIAESKIILTGFKPGIPTVWTITKAEHVLNSQGFKTNIEGEIYGK
jgi:phage protein D